MRVFFIPCFSLLDSGFMLDLYLTYIYRFMNASPSIDVRQVRLNPGFFHASIFAALLGLQVIPIARESPRYECKPVNRRRFDGLFGLPFVIGQDFGVIGIKFAELGFQGFY